MTNHTIRSLMVVDDDEIDQELYRRVIQRSGMVERVHSFTMVEDALEFLRNGGTVDAVLLDVRMPMHDGFDFLEVASAEFGDLFAAAVIVMLTTSLDPRDRERALSYPVVKGFFGKPLDLNQLEQLAELVEETTAVS